MILGWFIRPMETEDFQWHRCVNCPGSYFAACGCALGYERGLDLRPWGKFVECPSFDMHPGPFRELVWRIATRVRSWFS